MFRLFVLTIAAIFAYMLWRIIRVVARNRGSSSGDHREAPFEGHEPPRERFRDVRDADFEDLKPPGRSSGPSAPGS